MLGIVLGVLIPVIILGGAGFGYWWYLRKKRLQEEAGIAETRKKRKEEGGTGTVDRKKANEFEKNKAERKMESEILREVEEIERKYQEQGGSPVGRTRIEDNSQIMDIDAYNQPTMSNMMPGRPELIVTDRLGID